jgi:hypothetical protein
MTRWAILLAPLVAAVLVWAWRTRVPRDPPDTVTETWLKEHSYSRQGDRL